MNGQKTTVILLSVLVTISLGLSSYIFVSLEQRLITVENIVYSRGERIAILEQQSRENTAAHTRIEEKVDKLISLESTRR